MMIEKNIYMHISAGRGPAECCWVVHQIIPIIRKHCTDKAIKIKLIDQINGPVPNSLYSVLIKLEGDDLIQKIKDWEGTIQWIGTSPIRTNHKRKNWFIGISIITSIPNKKIDIDEISFQTYRASGPGGQHRNKVETAVRATHTKTGISATSTESRSQNQNKQLAIKKLKSIFNQQYLIIQRQKMEDKWKDHLSVVRGNPVKVFTGKNFKQK